MTGREYIAKRTGIAGFLIVPLLFLGVILAVCPSHWNKILNFSGVAIVVLAIILGFFFTTRIVCPFCSEWIGPILKFGKSPFVSGIPKKVKHCPICGENFDSELKDK